MERDPGVQELLRLLSMVPGIEVHEGVGQVVTPADVAVYTQGIEVSPLMRRMTAAFKELADIAVTEKNSSQWHDQELPQQQDLQGNCFLVEVRHECCVSEQL